MSKTYNKHDMRDIVIKIATQFKEYVNWAEKEDLPENSIKAINDVFLHKSSAYYKFKKKALVKALLIALEHKKSFDAAYKPKHRVNWDIVDAMVAENKTKYAFYTYVEDLSVTRDQLCTAIGDISGKLAKRVSYENDDKKLLVHHVKAWFKLLDNMKDVSPQVLQQNTEKVLILMLLYVAAHDGSYPWTK